MIIESLESLNSSNRKDSLLKSEKNVWFDDNCSDFGVVKLKSMICDIDKILFCWLFAFIEIDSKRSISGNFASILCEDFA